MHFKRMDFQLIKNCHNFDSNSWAESSKTFAVGFLAVTSVSKGIFIFSPNRYQDCPLIWQSSTSLPLQGILPNEVTLNGALNSY